MSITHSNEIFLSTTLQYCLFFQYFFPPDPHAGRKSSDSSKPAWLLMEHLPSYKTGAHCQQWPHVQLLQQYGQCQFSQQYSQQIGTSHCGILIYAGPPVCISLKF